MSKEQEISDLKLINECLKKQIEYNEKRIKELKTELPSKQDTNDILMCKDCGWYIPKEGKWGICDYTNKEIHETSIICDKFVEKSNKVSNNEAIIVNKEFLTTEHNTTSDVLKRIEDHNESIMNRDNKTTIIKASKDELQRAVDESYERTLQEQPIIDKAQKLPENHKEKNNDERTT